MKTASPELQKKIRELSKLSYKAITELSKCKSCGTCVIYWPFNIRKFKLKKGMMMVNNRIFKFQCLFYINFYPGQSSS